MIGEGEISEVEARVLSESRRAKRDSKKGKAEMRVFLGKNMSGERMSEEGKQVASVQAIKLKCGLLFFFSSLNPIQPLTILTYRSRVKQVYHSKCARHLRLSLTFQK